MVWMPHVFQSYNITFIGGVDQMIQSIEMYQIAVKGKKLW